MSQIFRHIPGNEASPQAREPRAHHSHRSGPCLFQRWMVLALALISLTPQSAFAQSPAGTPDPERLRLTVEALTRLKDVDLDKNPRLHATLLKVLDQTKGTPDFVRLIKQFGLTGHQEGLLAYAAAHPQEELGVEAMRLVLQSDHEEAWQALVSSRNTNAITGAVQALGNTKEPSGVTRLSSMLDQISLPLSARKQAVHGLTRTEIGSRELLRLAREERLPANLTFTAGMALQSVRWDQIQSAAAEVFPPPQSANAEPLPSLATLLATPGNAAKGREIFFAERTQCAACHRVQGEGREVGPDLSGIGAKLGPDALYESILHPSAGVSFGYEAYELELRSGEAAFGLIVSETEEEIALKDTQGIVTRYPKGDIVEKRQMTLSIMPAGLQATMTTQELVDLVAFLSSLNRE